MKLKVKTENFLMYGYNAGPPMAIPIYTVLPYCVIQSLYSLSRMHLLVHILIDAYSCHPLLHAIYVHRSGDFAALLSGWQALHYSQQRWLHQGTDHIMKSNDILAPIGTVFDLVVGKRCGVW